MLHLLKAEWIKINRNRLVSGLTVWVYPAGTLGVLALFALSVIFSESARTNVGLYPPTWVDFGLGPWFIVNSFFGQLMLVVFTAEVFGGEYQRSTWKNLVPNSHRWRLFLVKVIAIVLMLGLAYLAMTLIAMSLGGLITTAIGAEYGPALEDQTVRDFLRDLGLNAFTALSAGLIAAAYTAIGALVTRTTFGAILFGALWTMVDSGWILALQLLALFFQVPQIVQLYTWTPAYNLSNISAWATTGAGYQFPPIQEYVSEIPAFTSILVIAVWVVGLIGLNLWLFRRQDLTN